MFSFFPSLLILEGFAPFLLRVTIGTVFVYWAYGKLKRRKDSSNTIVGISEALVGILLIVGFLTQVISLISAFILGARLIKKIQNKQFLTDGLNYYLILFIISISLILTGSGFLAFDLPL